MQIVSLVTMCMKCQSLISAKNKEKEKTKKKKKTIINLLSLFKLLPSMPGVKQDWDIKQSKQYTSDFRRTYISYSEGTSCLVLNMRKQPLPLLGYANINSQIG